TIAERRRGHRIQRSQHGPAVGTSPTQARADRDALHDLDGEARRPAGCRRVRDGGPVREILVRSTEPAFWHRFAGAVDRSPLHTIARANDHIIADADPQEYGLDRVIPGLL